MAKASITNSVTEITLTLSPSEFRHIHDVLGSQTYTTAENYKTWLAMHDLKEKEGL